LDTCPKDRESYAKPRTLALKIRRNGHEADLFACKISGRRKIDPQQNRQPNRTILICLLIISCVLFQVGSLAKTPRVVVTIKPIHSLVSGVMDGIANPKLLLKGSVSAHSYSLKPSDARSLQEADLVVWVGEELETFLKKPLASLVPKVKVLKLVNQETISTTTSRLHTHKTSNRSAVDTEEQNQAHTLDKHIFVDPHIWLDPFNAIAIVKITAETLSAMDKNNSEHYGRNSRLLIRGLGDLHKSLKQQLKPVRNKPFMVYHDAYGLFVKRYGLNSAGGITIGPDRKPSAQRLHRVREVLLETGAGCVFIEPQFEPKWMKSILQGTKARTAILDPVGVKTKLGRQAYFDLMNGLGQSMSGCLQQVGN